MKLTHGHVGRQGVRRRLDVGTAMLIDVVAMLGKIGVPARDGLRLARELQRTDQRETALSEWLALRYNADEHRADLGRRLGQAAERVVARRRGRPPARTYEP